MEFQDLCSVATSFSPFPHGTCSLSVRKINLGYEGGPPLLGQDKLVLSYLREKKSYYRTNTFYGRNSISFHSFNLN